jgi:hypothetical protein
LFLLSQMKRDLGDAPAHAAEAYHLPAVADAGRNLRLMSTAAQFGLLVFVQTNTVHDVENSSTSFYEKTRRECLVGYNRGYEAS